MVRPSIGKFLLLVVIAERNNQIQEIKEIHFLSNPTLGKVETYCVSFICFGYIVPRKIAS